jgi:hypothetical protein
MSSGFGNICQCAMGHAIESTGISGIFVKRVTQRRGHGGVARPPFNCAVRHIRLRLGFLCVSGYWAGIGAFRILTNSAFRPSLSVTAFAAVPSSFGSY